MNGIPQYLPFVLVGAAGMVILAILALMIGLIALKVVLSLYVLKKGALPRQFRLLRDAWQPVRTTRNYHHGDDRQRQR
jgi:hypothetical protein